MTTDCALQNGIVIFRLIGITADAFGRPKLAFHSVISSTGSSTCAVFGTVHRHREQQEEIRFFIAGIYECRTQFTLDGRQTKPSIRLSKWNCRIRTTIVSIPLEFFAGTQKKEQRCCIRRSFHRQWPAPADSGRSEVATPKPRQHMCKHTISEAAICDTERCCLIFASLCHVRAKL